MWHLDQDSNNTFRWSACKMVKVTMHLTRQIKKKKTKMLKGDFLIGWLK